MIPSTTANSPAERQRRREWNRGPLQALFPRMPAAALERVLDVCIDKGAVYDLSEGRRWNARRLSSLVVAHARHNYSDYDRLLREERVERYEARRRTGPALWKLLRQWSPWEESNEALERCFEATLLRPEERDPEWDPMDIDSDAEDGENNADDPMDVD